MARVDFYVLANAGPEPRHLFACRLAEKAYRLKNSVHIHTRDRNDAQRLDDLLWTFRDGSFVPHAIVGQGDAAAAAAVTIGFESAEIAPRDLLINLDDEIPPGAGTFPRVAELVSSDEECRLSSRKRFAAYRDQGHSLETHKI